jgi:hypothetical protein
MIKAKTIKNLKPETQAVKMKKINNKMINQKILKIYKLEVEENNLQATVKEEERKLKTHLDDVIKC